VDKEGEVLDMLVQKRRNKAAALKLLRKLLKNQRYAPETIVTDGLGSDPAALKTLNCRQRHRPGRLRDNNRVENKVAALIPVCHVHLTEPRDNTKTCYQSKLGAMMLRR